MDNTACHENIFFISYDNQKAFPVKIQALNIVALCPLTLYDHWKEPFFVEKRVEVNIEGIALKEENNHKKFILF